MTARVYYHHPEDERYSLAYVTTNREDISDRDNDIHIEQYQLNEEVYVLYTNTGTSGTVDDLVNGFDRVLDDMDEKNRLISMRFLQLFEGIIEKKELEEGKDLAIYKQIELDQIPVALEHINWNTSVTDIAGQLMSTLVLKHTLPNANHRTSIAMAEWYIESIDSEFSFPKMVTKDYDWMEWIDPYITESKRLLTVRRNTTAFGLLEKWGCDVIERKGGIEINPLEYELDMNHSEALVEYTDRHKNLCTKLMIDSVVRAGHDYLTDERGPDKEQFVTYLENVE